MVKYRQDKKDKRIMIAWPPIKEGGNEFTGPNEYLDVVFDWGDYATHHKIIIRHSAKHGAYFRLRVARPERRVNLFVPLHDFGEIMEMGEEEWFLILKGTA